MEAKLKRKGVRGSYLKTKNVTPNINAFWQSIQEMYFIFRIKLEVLKHLEESYTK